METGKLQTLPLRVDGSFVTAAIRSADNPAEFCKNAAPTLTLAQVDAIINRRARIEGDNYDGFEYVENDA
jgi:hypothetical protein